MLISLAYQPISQWLALRLAIALRLSFSCKTEHKPLAVVGSPLGHCVFPLSFDCGIYRRSSQWLALRLAIAFAESGIGEETPGVSQWLALRLAIAF